MASHAIELTLFLWHTPADTTETVAEQSARLQPSINLHAPVTDTSSILVVDLLTQFILSFLLVLSLDRK